MPAKTADRIKAMRERAATLAPQPDVVAADKEQAPERDVTVADVSAHFGAALDPLVRNHTIQHIPIGHIAPDARPEMRQPRLLPPPEALIDNGQPAPAYRELVGELLILGQSLKQQQIQPIVVYPGTSAVYPAARYLILVGQRRWTAANLLHMETLDSIVVDQPTLADRVRIQYAENEDREEFSDMERAWALLYLAQAHADFAVSGEPAGRGSAHVARALFARIAPDLVAFEPPDPEFQRLYGALAAQLRPR